MGQYRIAPEANLYKIPDAVDFRYAGAVAHSRGPGISRGWLLERHWPTKKPSLPLGNWQSGKLPG